MCDFARVPNSRISMILRFSRHRRHAVSAFRRAAAQKQILLNGAKHSPPSLLSGGPTGKIQGSSSLRDIDLFIHSKDSGSPRKS